MKQPKVLCVSFDTAVSNLRCAALKRAGYSVTATIDVNEALHYLSCEKFDLVIVGHRFATTDKFVLALEAEEKANIPVLLVCGAMAEEVIPAAGRVYALEGTAGLLAAASALLCGEAGGAPQGAALPEGELHKCTARGCAMLFRDDDEDDELFRFADRAEAGRLLGAKLIAYSRKEGVIVLGLPRGGVPVACEVARVLGAPLDVLVVRKLGTPGRKELAMGAIAPGGVQVLDLSTVKQLCVPGEVIEEVAAAERKELQRQESEYRGRRPPLALAGKTVILVDDGIATGSCILAAIAAVRKQGAAQVVVAVPVAPANALNAIRIEADEVISLLEPEIFLAVSQWYEDFSQISDDQVCSLLERSMSSDAVPVAA